MELSCRDRALLVEDALVIADLHVGKGSASNIDVPIGDDTDQIERLTALVDRHEPAEIVIAGDLLHSFSTVPRTVTDTVAAIRQVGTEADTPVIVTPGNHDAMLDSVWDGPTPTEHRIGDTVVLHGHERPQSDAERYVIGHDHPTIEIEGQRRPCYLVGEGVYEGADVVVLPAFNKLPQGVRVNDMRAGEFQSPLVTDVDAFRPVVRDVRDRETLTFPPLGEFRQML